MTHRVFGAAATLIALTGCGPQMMDPSDPMHGEITVARSESAKHRDRTVAAATLDDAMSELVRHDQAMGGTVHAMHGALDDMSHCSGGAAPMHVKVKEVDDMTREHGERMRGAKDLREAQDEVGAHHAAMLTQFDSMQATMRNMSCGMMGWH